MVVIAYLLLFILIDIIHADQPDISIQSINYNLASPDKIYILPPSLQEVSGITGSDASSIACVQDENGIIFIYDLLKEQIRKQYSFYLDGDYEGIAIADKTVYILRSDGRLFEVTGYESGKVKTVSYSTGIPAMDNEGLCFDKNANRLLIAPKTRIEKKSGNKDERYIYAFDLKTKKLIEKPVFIFNVSELKNFANDNRIRLPKGSGRKGDKNETELNFTPTAIGINPVTSRLFLISAIEKLLFVFDMKGNIEFIEKLDSDLFIQPEGITFLNNGDMLISNEGQNKKPTIVRFSYSGNKTK